MPACDVHPTQGEFFLPAKMYIACRQMYFTCKRMYIASRRIHITCRNLPQREGTFFVYCTTRITNNLTNLLTFSLFLTLPVISNSTTPRGPIMDTGRVKMSKKASTDKY